jgi:hypothetical protein
LCVDVGHGAADAVAFVVGNVLGGALVRPGGVVMRLVSGQDGMQVLPARIRTRSGSSRRRVPARRSQIALPPIVNYT